MITSKDLQIIFIALYDNNPSGYNTAFRNAGYDVPANAVQAKRYVVPIMYDLYFSNPYKLQNIMNEAPWNPNAGNYTTANGDMRQILLGYLKEKINTGDGNQKLTLAQIQDWLFGNQTTVVEQTVTTPSTAGAVAGVVGSSIFAIAVIVFAIILVRNFKGNKKAIIFTLIGAVVLLLIAVYLIYKSAKNITAGSATSTSTTSGHGGISDLLGNASGLLGGWWTNIFGGGGGGTTNAQEIGCDPTECDPNRIGYNMCGDQWYPCG